MKTLPLLTILCMMSCVDVYKTAVVKLSTGHTVFVEEKQVELLDVDSTYVFQQSNFNGRPDSDWMISSKATNDTMIYLYGNASKHCIEYRKGKVLKIK